jgi:hypothetical protein
MTLYGALQDQGRTSVLVLKPTAASAGNGLWWGSSYHAVAGAGYDAKNAQILFADPDSNKGNLPANAGWWNLKPDKTWDQSKEGTDAAIARVQANMYTDADGKAAPPLPGNKNGAGGAYANSDLYGTMTVNDKGLVTASDAAKGETGRLVNTRIAEMLMISPTLAAQTDFKLKDGKFQSTFAFLGDVNSKVDEIELFPTVALADSLFGLPAGLGWSAKEATKDPYGYDRLGGGLDLTADSLGNLLSLGSMLSGVTLDTDSQFSDYDVYYHDSLTGDWVVQSVGADPLDVPPFQQDLAAVPAPTSCVMLGLGLVTVGIAAGARGRGRSAGAPVPC